MVLVTFVTETAISAKEEKWDWDMYDYRYLSFETKTFFTLFISNKCDDRCTRSLRKCNHSNTKQTTIYASLCQVLCFGVCPRALQYVNVIKYCIFHQRMNSTSAPISGTLDTDNTCMMIVPAQRPFTRNGVSLSMVVFIYCSCNHIFSWFLGFTF